MECGVRDPTGGLRDQKGGISDHIPGIRGSQAMGSGSAAYFKGALSRIINISLNSQNIYLCHRKPTNNGLFLLTIAILVC